MKSLIVSSVALAASVASAAAPCYVETVSVDSAGTPIAIGDLTVYQGAVLTVLSYLNGATPVPGPVTITDASGSVDFVDGKLKVNSNEAGELLPLPVDCESFTINALGHTWGKFFYKSSEPVDFFQTATMMTDGNLSAGEYFKDDADKPIHLYMDATDQKGPVDNWYVVSMSAEPSPPVVLESNTPTHLGGDYTNYTAGSSIITETDLELLKTQYGSAIDFTFWVPRESDSQAPMVASTACPNGMVTAATFVTDNFKLETVGAHTTAFVLATTEFKTDFTTTPAPNGGSTTTLAPPTGSSSPPTDQTTTTTTPSSDQTTTTTTPSSDQTTTTTTTSPGITSSAVSRAVVTGLTAVFGLLLF